MTHSSADLVDPRTAVPSALHDLGVGPCTLDDRQREALDRDGFLVLRGHMPEPMLAALRATHDALMSEKYADLPAGGHGQRTDYWHHEAGTRRLADLASEGEVFDRMHSDPLLLAAVHHLMPRPFKLDSINAREALPGHGRQGLHRDRTADDEEDGDEWCVNSAWLLDPFTAENGATRVVPGSHRWPAGPDGVASGVEYQHPDERLLTAPAGSVVIFPGRLWHSGTQNRTQTARRVVHVSFVRRECDLGARAQRLRIRKATWDRLTPASRWLLEV